MHSEGNFYESAARGALGGFVASAAMMPVLLLMRRVGATPEEFPKRVEKKLARKAGVPEASRGTQSNLLTWMSHLGFGTFWGALFGAFRHSYKQQTFPFAPLFGLAVYAMNFFSWIPALGIFPPLWRQREPAGMLRIMSHAYYGALLGLAYDFSHRLFGSSRMGTGTATQTASHSTGRRRRAA